MKQVIVCMFSFLFLLSAAGGAYGAEYLYYSDKPSPPDSKREPPFSESRRKIEGDFGYVSIRYFTEKYSEEGKTPLKMTLSVGNGLLQDQPIFFQVETLKLFSDQKELSLEPSFYNEILKKRESGMEALIDYRHKAPSHLHRRIEVVCLDCTPEHKTLRLELKVVIDYLQNRKILDESIRLYQGQYEV